MKLRCRSFSVGPAVGRRAPTSCRSEASFVVLQLVSARKHLFEKLDRPAEATCSAGQTISSLVGRSGSSRSTRRYSTPTAVAVIDAECRADSRQERRNRGSDVVSVPSGYWSTVQTRARSVWSVRTLPQLWGRKNEDIPRSTWPVHAQKCCRTESAGYRSLSSRLACPEGSRRRAWR